MSDSDVHLVSINGSFEFNGACFIIEMRADNQFLIWAANENWVKQSIIYDPEVFNLQVPYSKAIVECLMRLIESIEEIPEENRFEMFKNQLLLME